LADRNETAKARGSARAFAAPIRSRIRAGISARRGIVADLALFVLCILPARRNLGDAHRNR